MKGKTHTGFNFEIAPDALEDVETLEMLAKVQNGDGLKLFNVLERLLGLEQKDKLYEHIRNETGKVMINDLAAELEDIMSSLSEDADSKN